MVDAVALLALGLLVIAVIASVVPAVPAGAIALLAVYIEYLFGTGNEMGLWLLFSFTVVGGLAILIDLFGGAITARAKGASQQTTVLAAAVGLVLFIVAGPIGVLVGMFGTVLWSELRDDRPFEQAWDNAVWTTAGMLASGAAVFLLVLSMLVAYVVFVLWLGSGMTAF
ncbi:MAG: DUF456 domain-containing protein [Halolamina sp.]|uniref:DUF456 domain-containing protein n=1 Tax=Halolamina sp. TaxID=1940283 RepID=UPI002FC3444B